VDRFSPRSLGLRLRLGRRRFLALILEEEEERSGWFGRSLGLRLRLGRRRFLALILEKEEEGSGLPRLARAQFDVEQQQV